MELPGQAHRGHSRGHRQGLLHRPLGPSGSRRGRHHQGRTMRNSSVPLRKNHLDPQLPPRARPRRGTHRRSRTADRPGPPSAGHGGSGRHPGQRRSRAAGAARQERHARRLDPAGSLSPADRPSAKRGHAGHARQLRSQHQEPGVRPARGRGHAFRRPRDGESRAFRRQRQGDPPGDRPRGDRQDHPGRRGGRGRCETLPAANATTANGSPDSAPATRSNTKPSSARPCTPPRGVSAWARRSPPWPGPTATTRCW